MKYKLTKTHALAIHAADAEAQRAGLPAYGLLIELLVKLSTNSAQREVARTVKNCNEMVDIQTKVREALEPLRAGLIA